MNLIELHQKIYEIRGQKVMLDFDLADLYEVQTKVLNQAVKRNNERFPERFMFRLTIEEWDLMRSQFVTASNQNKRNNQVTPFAFTEHGVTMLSSVLKSEKAIQINIAVIDAFIFLKQYSLSHDNLYNQLKQLEQKYDKQFDDVFDAINYLLKKESKRKQLEDRNKIGY
jgi:phage regulator Rha-like protein